VARASFSPAQSFPPHSFHPLSEFCWSLSAAWPKPRIAGDIAVTVGLLGFLATAPALISVVQLFKGKLFPYPAAIEEKAAMSALMLIYVLLCVRSFITARRTRV
jgi:hypothetical protein